MNSLFKLEEAGIKIVTSLSKIHTRLETAIHVNPMDERLSQAFKRSSVECLEDVIKRWIFGGSDYPTNWISLLDILKELNLEDLSQQIDDYLLGK